LKNLQLQRIFIMSAITGLTSLLDQSVNSVQAQIATTQNQLATGVKQTNPAIQGIVTRLSANISQYSSIGTNITAAQNVVAVGQTSLTSITSLINQMQQLATQAASGGLSTTDLGSLNTTFTALASQISAAVSNATINGTSVLQTGGGLTVQIGLTTAASATASLATQGLDTAVVSIATALTISTGTAASAAITSLTALLSTVSTSQSNLNAYSVALSADQSAVTSLGTNLQNTVNSLQAVDQTALQAQLQQLNNQQSVDYYLVSQMNTAAQAVLTLFR